MKRENNAEQRERERRRGKRKRKQAKEERTVQGSHPEIRNLWPCWVGITGKEKEVGGVIDADVSDADVNPQWNE